MTCRYLLHLLLYFLVATQLFGQSPRTRIRHGHLTPANTIELLGNDRLRSVGFEFECVWDLLSGDLLSNFPRKDRGDSKYTFSFREACETQDRRVMAADTLGGTLRYRPVTSDGRFTYERDQAYLLPVCPSRDDQLVLDFPVDGLSWSGETLFSISEDGLLHRWAYPELEALSTVRLERATLLTAEANGTYLSGDGRHFFAVAKERIHVWQIPSGKYHGEVPWSEQTIIVDFHPTLARLVVTEPSLADNPKYPEYPLSVIDLENLQSGETFHNFRYTTHELTRARYSEDGATIYAPNQTGITEFDGRSGQRLRTLRSKIDVSLQQLYADPGGNGLWMGRKRRDDVRWSKYFSFIPNTNVRPINEDERKKEPLLPGEIRIEDAMFERYVQNASAGTPENDELRTLLLDHPSNRRIADKTLRIVIPQTAKTDRFLLFRWDGSAVSSIKRVEMTGAETYLTSSVSYRDELLAIGTLRGDIRLYDATGKLITAVSDSTFWSAQQLAFSHDGKHLFSSSKDGVVTVRKAKDLRQIAQILLLNRKDWIVVGPNNLFDASPGALGDIYFEISGTDGEKENIELYQMKDRYYEPGLLQKLMGYSEVPIRSVKGLEEVPLYPEIKLELNQNAVRVTLTPRNGGVGRVALFANGKELDYDARPTQDDTSFEVDLSDYRRFFLRDNVISVKAYNLEESLRSGDVSVNYVYTNGPEVNARGTNNQAPSVAFSKEEARSASLHVICVGTSDYAGESIDLTFPNQDARAMSRALQSVGNALFGTGGRVNVHCLTTDPSTMKDTLGRENIRWQYPTKENIAEVIRNLQEKVKAQDVVVVYFSGHGKTISVNNREQFHYLIHTSTSANVIDPNTLGEMAISSAELSEWLKKIPAYKQVVIIDACNAGRAIDDLSGTRNLNSSQIRALDQMSGRAGMYLIAGSAANMVSFEASNYGQGLLTYALLEGMRGTALARDEVEPDQYLVGVTELFEYAQRRVPELAEKINGVQQPQITYPQRAGSFPIGISNKETKIPLAAEKPIFVRSIFQAEAGYVDDLGLSHAVGERLKRLSKRGTSSPLVYLDIDEIPRAFRIWGRYKRGGDGKITVDAVYAQGGEKGVSLRIPPTAEDQVAAAVYRALIKEITTKE